MIRAVLWLAVSTAAQATEDKTSLGEQERAARALCSEQGWQVVDVLSVPGHSRHYIDIHECSADMLRAGIDAFERLMRHWRERDFEVLVVRDGNRFARTQSLHTYVVEATIRAGARIYSLADGWVDAQNFRMYAAMNGYMAAAQVAQFAVAREAALDRNASRGLPGTGRLPAGFKVQRDSRGQALGIVPDPVARCVLDDAADALLSGAGWQGVAQMLAEAGHRTPEGKNWTMTSIRRWFYAPATWGHSARHFAHHPAGKRRWVYDTQVAPPDDVTLYRDTHPALWVGEHAEAIKAELRRRESTRGSEQPSRYYRFSRLVVCATCGYYYVNRSKPARNWSGCGCSTRAFGHYYGRACTNKRHLTTDYIQSVVDGLLRQAIATADINSLLRPDRPASDTTQALAEAEAEHASAQRKLLALVHQSAESGVELQAAYAEAMRAVQAQIEALARQISRLSAQARAADTTTQQAALNALDLDAFWQQDSRHINITLHRIFGKRRLLAVDGAIIGLCDAPDMKKT